PARPPPPHRVFQSPPEAPHPSPSTQKSTAVGGCSGDHEVQKALWGMISGAGYYDHPCFLCWTSGCSHRSVLYAQRGG
uniref:Uncharacterized protein n=1 Tax=Neolamprologus brichardi TaxID=32507 RepID=A0A3Q4G437_NEOBR